MKFLLILLTLVQFNFVLGAEQVTKPQGLKLVKYELWNLHPIKIERKTQLQATLKSQWSEELEVAMNLIK